MSSHFIPSPNQPTEFGMSQNELDANKECQKGHYIFWRVVDRNCNYSAFNGYHRTWSAYSKLRCFRPGCGRIWRTKAAYVDRLPDMSEAENEQWLRG